MSINMADVKQIINNVNNKEVVKIEDGLGNVLWQKVSEQPYRRLEYLIFDGTCYCASAEHNADNRAYRLDFMQTGWASNNSCYPFGIWTNTNPYNILLIRNQKKYTTDGFEVCRVGNSSGFGKHPPETYLNSRIVAEMRWGTDTTVYYRLRNQSSSSYIENGVGVADGRTGTNTGNFFIGAINDGGGGTYSNANGLLVGRIYEVAIAGSNSFDDYGYAYVPCQRKSDGAIGFKQPHADNFYPLLNKSDGSVVTEVTAHMGPVVDNDWDGVTYTITPSPYAAEWHTIYNNSKGTKILKLGGTNNPRGRWILGSVPANISDKATKLRITYKQYVEYNAYDGEGSGYKDNDTRWAKLIFDNGGNNITVNPAANTILTQEFDYTQGKDILYAYYYPNWNTSNTGLAQSRWYRNGLASVSIASTDYWGLTRIWYILITKVEEYY